jgi:hypothetical protein
MRKLPVIAAALALSVSALPAVIVQAQAAPAKSPYCSTPAQANSLSWQQYYGCWGGPAVKPAMYRPAPAQAKGGVDFCKLPAEANSLSWQQYYGCWRAHH